MPHHWYAIAEAQREKMNAAHQINSAQRYVSQIVDDFSQLVKHCDYTTFDWKDATKVRRYWKKKLTEYINQLAS